MTTMSRAIVRARPALLAAVLLLATATLAADPAEGTARDVLIRAATAKLGTDAVVEIVALDLPAGAADRFVDARIDPAAKLGRPMRVVLVPARGSRVLGTASLRVVAAHAVARRDLPRGTTVTSDDVEIVTGEVQQVPLRRLPGADEVIGSRVLRTIPSAAIVMPGAVALRRTVEPGDRVTAVAMAGDVQVSAEVTAADGGNPGDVIRVVNPGSRRSLRGRVVREGLVEVGYAR
ncbi:MAG: flagella basal body P-ring formation protein FlgA [Acidobacteria bacterium SCN 69-37]|nr:MAG: flagella basal body P-ring formation protein FlgA [Acidobacteria bacterium SCN 69-37]